MSDTPDLPPELPPGPPPPEPLPLPRLDDPRAPFWRRLSALWLVPLLALLLSLGVAWKSYSERGTLIEITFDDAAGLIPGQSVLKYRQVVVGKVEKVGFTEDLSKVLVSVRVDRDVASHIDSAAKFWIVHPQIGFGGVSGLDTVLSGVFIEGYWNKDWSGQPPARFEGLAKAPLQEEPNSGTWVTLSARDGGTLIEGAPVIYRGLKVGQLRDLRLDRDGRTVLINAFVMAPYDRQLTSQTLFWDTSGFSVTLGPGGVKLNVRSISSLVQGGVEFSDIVTGGGPIELGHTYHLYEDEGTARSSIFNGGDAPRALFSILLDGSVQGLGSGDAVNFRGVKVGEVTGLTVQSEPGPNGSRLILQRVDLALVPARMGLPAGATPADAVTLLNGEVAAGLRARVTSAGLLGSALAVDLVPVPDAAPATIDATAKPYPLLPTTAPEIRDATASAQGLFARVSKLPIERIMDFTASLIDNVNRFAAQPDTQNLPHQVAGLLGDARGLIGSPEAQAVPKTLNDTLAGAGKFVGDLNDKGAVQSVVGAMSDASAAAKSVYAATDGVGAMVDTYTKLGRHVDALPLDEVTKRAADLMDSLNTLTASPKMQDLPRALTGALDQVTGVLDELQKGGAVAKLNATMGSAQDAAGTLAQAADKLPDLVARLNKAADAINATLAAYNGNSPFNAETVATLRALRETARSVQALAVTLQRNPQALILGR